MADVAVESLFWFDTGGLTIPEYSGPINEVTSVINTGAGSLTLPANAEDWCEITFQLDGGGGYEAVFTDGDLRPEFTNLSYSEEDEAFYLEFFFQPATFDLMDVKTGSSFTFDAGSNIYAGALSGPPGSVSSDGDRRLSYDTDGYIFLAAEIRLQGGAAGHPQTTRLFIAINGGGGGGPVDPPTEFLTSFVGSREIT